MTELQSLSVAVDRQQELFTTPEDLALAGFLSGYSGLTLDAYRLDLRQFVAWCTERDVRIFGARRVDIEQFGRHLEALGKARATVARRLGTIVCFYRYAEEEGLIERSPAVHVRRPRLDYASHGTGLPADDGTAIDRRMTTIRPATSADRATVASALASAFSDDPLFTWMAGAGPDKPLEPKMRRMFDAFLKLDLVKPDHLVFVDEDGTGAAIWKQPNKWKVPNSEIVRALPALLRAFGTRAPTMIGALSAIEKVHPKDEHYYLEALGTRKDMQSKGVGSAMIGAMLERSDAEGLPAYLESSNPRNVPFYARHGFETRGEIVCGKGAPTVTAMWREPRG